MLLGTPPTNSLRTSFNADPTCTGCIINISSLMAHKPAAGAAAYAAAKAGVVGMSSYASHCCNIYDRGRRPPPFALPCQRLSITLALTVSFAGLTSALCLEMASRSIRVNALLPGWVESPMWDSAFIPPCPPSSLCLPKTPIPTTPSALLSYYPLPDISRPKSKRPRRSLLVQIQLIYMCVSRRSATKLEGKISPEYAAAASGHPLRGCRCRHIPGIEWLCQQLRPKS